MSNANFAQQNPQQSPAQRFNPPPFEGQYDAPAPQQMPIPQQQFNPIAASYGPAGFGSQQPQPVTIVQAPSADPISKVLEWVLGQRTGTAVLLLMAGLVIYGVWKGVPAVVSQLNSNYDDLRKKCDESRVQCDTANRNLVEKLFTESQSEIIRNREALKEVVERHAKMHTELMLNQDKMLDHSDKMLDRIEKMYSNKKEKE